MCYDIKCYAKKSGVPLWKIADALCISEATITRKLRHELTAEEKQKMTALIDSIKKGESV